MRCSRCGREINEGQKYCSACGAPVDLAQAAGTVGSGGPAYGAVAPPARSGGRDLAWHVRLLGILWIVFGALRMIPGLGILAFGHLRLPGVFPFEFWGWFPFLHTLGLLFLALGALGIAAGFGLLNAAPWARVLALVVGALALLHPPFGTALGIYTLWALLPAQAEGEYRRMSGSR